MFNSKKWNLFSNIAQDDAGNITSAKLQAIRKHNDSEVKHQPLSDKFGQELSATLNWFYDELLRSNAATGTIKIGNMNNFHGATLEIKLILPEK